MLNLNYIVPRVIRKALPDFLFDFLLEKELIIKPGLETLYPQHALSQYLNFLNEKQISIKDKHCLLFGYGGNFAVGCMLLEQGAKHVTLLDKYARPNHQRNENLLPRYERYLKRVGKQILSHPDYLTLHHTDVQNLPLSGAIDIILSASVLEHLDEVNKTIEALVRLTTPQGVHVHFVDLRDHFFKYPFEMLCYSNTHWQRWLNPTQHLNRYRLHDYQQIFQRYFLETEISVLETDSHAFQKTRSRIKEHFLTGTIEIDAATHIVIFAQGIAKPT